MKPAHETLSPQKTALQPQLTAAGECTLAKRLLLGIYRLSDPKISLASISAMLLGTCAASMYGQVDWPWLLPTVIGILFLEAAKNASGDVFDYDSGTDLAVADADRSPFSGGKRVIVDGLMTRQQTIVAASVFYLLGITAGLAIVFLHEPKILIIGFIGVAFAYFYNAPPLKLSYRGLGEAVVAITYGPLICCGTYLVLCRDLPITVVAVSVPLGILIAAFLVINEFPDRKADLGAGKMNLVVQLGEKKAGQLYMVMIVTAFVGILFLPQTGLPNTVWLGFLGLPFGAASARKVLTTKETVSLIPAQHWMLISFVLTAVGLGIGLLF